VPSVSFSADSKVFSQPANQVAQHAESQWSTIQTYCFGCHNEGVRAGNLFWTSLAPSPCPNTPRSRESCAQIARAPDAAARHAQPSQQEVDALVGWLESTLDESSRRTLRATFPSSA